MKLFYVVRYQGPATTRWPASYKSLPVHLKGGENSQIAHFCKLCCNLLLFRKYVGIYFFWVLEFGEIEFSMVLDLMELENHEKILKIFYGTWVPKNFSGKFEVYFFKKFEFLEFKFHNKLEFHKFEF